MAFKALLSASLAAAAFGFPAAPVPAYAPEPAYPDLPPVYKYGYAVKDDYSLSNFNAEESRDGYNANGGYQVALPDGRTQHVTYVVNGQVRFYISYISYEFIVRS